MFAKKRILILAPHTDDGELGCGGTISRALEEGAEVFYAAFSTADESVPKQFPRNQLTIEVQNAMSILGVSQDHLILFKYEVRKLNYQRQQILEDLIQLRDDIKPDIIFTPSRRDIHQDHTTVTNECIRAFKFCSILGYELIWNNLSFSTDCFVSITRPQLDQKIKALGAYETQRGKDYMDPSFIESLAKVRGTQVGADFAETFEVIRYVIY